MSETRVQVATLICKIFLRFLDQLPNREGMLPLWLKILDILDRMMNSGQGDSLVRSPWHHYRISFLTFILSTVQEEAIPESLKNILLVMADGGYLVPPSQDPSKEEMWVETRKRLSRFLPDLFVEIFPDAASEPEKSQPGPTASSQPTTSDDGRGDAEKSENPAPPQGESLNGANASAGPAGDDEKEAGDNADTQPDAQDAISVD